MAKLNTTFPETEKSHLKEVIGPIIDWLIDWYMHGWLINRASARSVDCLIGWLIGWLIDWLIDWLTNLHPRKRPETSPKSREKSAEPPSVQTVPGTAKWRNRRCPSSEVPRRKCISPDSAAWRLRASLSLSASCAVLEKLQVHETVPGNQPWRKIIGTFQCSSASPYF